MTLNRYADKIQAEPTKKVILDTKSAEGTYSVAAHLENLMTNKNDMLGDVEYLA